MKEYIVSNVPHQITLKEDKIFSLRKDGYGASYQYTIKKGSQITEYFKVSVINTHPVVDERVDSDDNLGNAIISTFAAYGKKAYYDNKLLTKECKKISDMKHVQLKITKISHFYVVELKDGQYRSDEEALKAKVVTSIFGF